MRDTNYTAQKSKNQASITKKKKKQIKYIYFWIDLDWR